MDSYCQKYRKAWESNPAFKKWIKPTKDPSKALCKYCNSFVKAKHFDLVRHSETQKHKKCMAPFNDIVLSQPDISFSPHVPTETQIAHAKLALYAAVHTPFLAIDHLSDICCKTFADSKEKSSIFEFSSF